MDTYTQEEKDKLVTLCRNIKEESDKILKALMLPRFFGIDVVPTCASNIEAMASELYNRVR